MSRPLKQETEADLDLSRRIGKVAVRAGHCAKRRVIFLSTILCFEVESRGKPGKQSTKKTTNPARQRFVFTALFPV
jgi:hypothetical protein